MKLRDNQEAAVTATFRYINRGGRNGIMACPTAFGKSVVIAEIIRRILMKKPHVRFMMLTDTKELIEQNFERLKTLWPLAPAGIYSASVGRKQFGYPITFAGIQSAFRRPDLFGKIDVLLIDECFSGDTEILTEKGFVRFDQLPKDVKVAQVRSSDRNLTFVDPVRHIQKTPTSSVKHVYSDTGFDHLITENHDMLVERNGRMVKVKLKDLKHNAYTKIFRSAYAGGSDRDLTPWEKLHIAFQADGNLHNTNKDGSRILAFSFSKNRKIRKFLDLMEEGGFDYKHLDTRSEVGKVKGRERYMVYLPAEYDFRGKNVSSLFEISNMSSNMCSKIIEYMNLWDGHRHSETMYLYTNCDKNAVDFYQTVAVMCGYGTHVSRVVDDRSEKFSDVYRLFINKLGCSRTTGSVSVTEAQGYDGDVYCVTVPEGNIVVRRNDKVMVCGNCHMISEKTDSMYLAMIKKLRERNPDMVVIGLTATPYRLGMGLLTEGPIFDDIYFDMTKMDDFVKLIDDGFLSDLIPIRMKNSFDLTKIKMQYGEFQEKSLDENLNRDEITQQIVLESLPHIEDRKKGLCFCVSKSHAENMASRFNEMGVVADFIHSDLTKDEREEKLAKLARGEIKLICNVGVLTKGFDQPDIDFIIMARPTQSTSLYVQMAGRGMRVAVGKINCMILDFAGNTIRLGPVNDPLIPQPKGKQKGEPPIRICSECETVNHASAKFCKFCGHEFPPPKVKISPKLEAVDIIRRQDVPIIVDERVQNILVNKFTNRDGVNFVKISFLTSAVGFIDLYLSFDTAHAGRYAESMRMMEKLQFSTAVPRLTNTEDAREFISAYIQKPSAIKVWTNKPVPGKKKRYKQILGFAYGVEGE